MGGPLLSKQLQSPSHLRLGVTGLFNQLHLSQLQLQSHLRLGIIGLLNQLLLPSSLGPGQTRLSAMPGPPIAKQLASR
eukprot:7674024-Prorocentrum_lima.AAC.1